MLYLYLILFCWSFLAATVVPLGSEIHLLLLVRMQQAVVLPVAIATAGNYLGSCTTYWLGRKGAQAAYLHGLEGSPIQRRATLLYRRYGQAALLLAWVPIIGDVLVALAGAVRMPFGRFSVFVALGKASRYLLVAAIALRV